ncbi:hypothetical protein OG21DRAFT_511812 [Imleria badia]|nr:hypothetical protein OG21DRAFT_511812 [Imleria badia]
MRRLQALVSRLPRHFPLFVASAGCPWRLNRIFPGWTLAIQEGTETRLYPVGVAIRRKFRPSLVPVEVIVDMAATEIAHHYLELESLTHRGVKTCRQNITAPASLSPWSHIAQKEAIWDTGTAQCAGIST